MVLAWGLDPGWQWAEQEVLQPIASREEYVAGAHAQKGLHQHPSRPEPQGVQDRPRRGAAVRRIRCRSYLTPQNRMTSKSGHAEAGRKVLHLALEVEEEEELKEERMEAHRKRTLGRALEES